MTKILDQTQNSNEPSKLRLENMSERMAVKVTATVKRQP
jgi:hypothetical protein